MDIDAMGMRVRRMEEMLKNEIMAEFAELHRKFDLLLSAIPPEAFPSSDEPQDPTPSDPVPSDPAPTTPAPETGGEGPTSTGGDIPPTDPTPSPVDVKPADPAPSDPAPTTPADPAPTKA